jgi:hypothetical protein
MSTCRFHKHGQSTTVAELDLEQLLAKLLTATFRTKKSPQETAESTRNRKQISNLFATMEENVFKHIALPMMNQFTNASIPHVSNHDGHIVMDNLLHRIFMLLSTLNGTIGGFGTDLLFPEDAAKIYASMKQWVQVDKKELIQLSVGRASEEVWETAYQK